jgi:transcriptional regulator CtsR
MARTRADMMADHLEALVHQNGGEVEIQRGALAARFGCAPSQVNYVLATRFTLADGYVLESRPGAKGYIRIRLVRDGEWNVLAESILREVYDDAQAGLAQEQAQQLTAALARVGLITAREAALIRAILDRQVLRIALPERDRLRARILQAALRALAVGLPGEAAGRRDFHGV